MLLLPLVCSRGLRAALARMLDRLSARGRTGIAILPVAAILLKICVALPNPVPGFAACYASPTDQLPSASGGPCERSFEYPFAPRGLTRIDRTIAFTPSTWNLGFFNSTRFDYYADEAGARSRDRIAFSATWRGTVDERADAPVAVTYVGQGSVSVDGRQPVILTPSYQSPGAAQVDLGPGRHDVTVRYLFDDGFRIGQAKPPGPYAELALRLADGRPLPAAPIGRAPRAASAAADVLIAVGLTIVGLLYARLLGWDLAAVVAGSLGVWLVSAWTAGYVRLTFLFVFVGGLMAATVARPRRRWLLAAYLLLTVAIAGRVVPEYPGFDTVIYRSGGADWLTYESEARAILETWSLRSDEPVFYYQPLYRYTRFLLRLGLGEGDPPVVVFSLTALLFGIVLLLWSCARMGRAVARAPTLRGSLPFALLVAVGGLVLALVWSPRVTQYVEQGLSEYPTWIALPFLLDLMFLERDPVSKLIGVALLGASAITRPNQLPGAIVVFLAFGWREGWKNVARPAALFAAILLLPLVHNLVYGGAFVLTTYNPNTSMRSALEKVAALPGSLSAGSAAAGGFVERLEVIVGMTAPLYLAVVFHGLQVLWLSVWAWARRIDRVWWCLHLLPLAYLSVYLVYPATLYYPRHIVIAYLAMALTTAMFVREAFVRKEQDSRPVSFAAGSL